MIMALRTPVWLLWNKVFVGFWLVYETMNFFYGTMWIYREGAFLSHGAGQEKERKPAASAACGDGGGMRNGGSTYTVAVQTKRNPVVKQNSAASRPATERRDFDGAAHARSR